jgi:predicted ATPase
MARFIKSFNEIFNGKYILDDSDQGIKFRKSNSSEEIRILNLSSGEKQIILRGGFLLQNSSFLNNSLVLIDEPEISLHPQ